MFFPDSYNWRSDRGHEGNAPSFKWQQRQKRTLTYILPFHPPKVRRVPPPPPPPTFSEERSGQDQLLTSTVIFYFRTRSRFWLSIWSCDHPAESMLLFKFTSTIADVFFSFFFGTPEFWCTCLSVKLIMLFPNPSICHAWHFYASLCVQPSILLFIQIIPISSSLSLSAHVKFIHPG